MNKKKSQEYLDKINQTFADLDDPAHEIDIESLLGYIRIFYSSVKSIPVQNYDLAGSTHKAIKNENNKKDRSSYSEHNNPITYVDDSNSEFNIGNTENSPKIEVERQREETPAPWPESKSNEISSEDDEAFPLDNNEVIGENIKDDILIAQGVQAQDYIKTFDEEDEEEAAQIPAVEIKESKPEEKQGPVFEGQKTEAVKIPEVQPEPVKPIEVLQTYQEIKIEQPAAKVEPLAKPKETFLTKIESEQSRPLYQPTGHQAHNPSDAIESLFREKSPTGLVDFLGLSPLDNLNKAWGLNEKMLVIKDLFEDDFAAFNDTVEMINKFTSFEEVKYYLINNVVDKFKWNDLSRFKKASDFIVQTKRLFVR